MSSNLRDDPAARSIRELEKQAKQQGSLRQQAERQAFGGAPRRWRRQNGRTEFLAIRTFPETKALITQIADKHKKYLGEVVEEAVELLHRSLEEKERETR